MTHKRTGSIDQVEYENDSNKRTAILVIVWMLILANAIGMLQASNNTEAAPVIVDENNSGSWTDSFEDDLGISIQNNVDIANGLVKLTSVDNIKWDYEYLADVEPDSDGWILYENVIGDMASVSGGILTLDTTTEDGYWWYLYNWGISNAVGVTLEARIKIESTGSDYGLHLIIRDGIYEDGLVFFNNRIVVTPDSDIGTYYMDTTDNFHTYRLTAKGNDFLVYVDGVLRLDGTGKYNDPHGMNHVLYGDVSSEFDRYSRSYCDYIKFNTSGPFPPDPVAYQTEGNITSTEISLPTGHSWESLLIDKSEIGMDNNILVSVLDGLTHETILGFADLSGLNIDLSTIDPILYPSIRLRANFSGNGTCSPRLFEWSVTWRDVTAPETPTGFTVNNPLTGYSLILSWNLSTEHDLFNYVIYYSLDNATFYWLANVSANTYYFNHYGLTQGSPYFYKIAAADEVPNQSPFSEIVNGTPDIDTDRDGIGNRLDDDDDNDGILDDDDPYPLNPLNDITTTIENINDTVNDLQNIVLDIQTDLSCMNTTLGQLKGGVDYLNQTLPLKVDDLAAQLTGVNDSILNKVLGTETNILSELADVNTSLATHIQNLLMNLTNNITGMNSSLSNQLTILLNNMTLDHEALRKWLELVLTEIDANLTATNTTLHKQLGDLQKTTDSYYSSLRENLTNVFVSLSRLEGNLSQQHDTISGAIKILNDTIIDENALTRSEILGKINGSIALLQGLDANMTIHDSDIKMILDSLDDLVQIEHDLTRTELMQNLTTILSQLRGLDGNISSHDDEVKENITVLQGLIDNLETLYISDLSDKLATLKLNLSQHDSNITRDVANIEQSLIDFQDEINDKLSAVNSTLENMAKLNDILTDLQALDQSLQTASDELETSIEEKPSKDFLEERILLVEMLLLIVLCLVVINMILTLIVARRKRSNLDNVTQTKEIESEGGTPLQESESEIVNEEKLDNEVSEE